ncbi:MAG: hypothetical protein Q9221_005918 [Calogaya cf. arnoldii]
MDTAPSNPVENTAEHSADAPVSEETTKAAPRPHRPPLTVPEQAAIITLRLCCSMTWIQIFQALSVPPETARRTYFRVRQGSINAHGEGSAQGQGENVIVMLQYCSEEQLGRKKGGKNRTRNVEHVQKESEHSGSEPRDAQSSLVLEDRNWDQTSTGVGA